MSYFYPNLSSPSSSCTKNKQNFSGYLERAFYEIYLFKWHQNPIILLLIARNSQNMSYFLLPQNGVFSFPSIPAIGQTLQLIQTKKNLPISTLSFFEKNIRESQPEIDDDENSLDFSLIMQHKSQAQHTEAGTTPKKKRTGCICKKTKCLKMYCECFSSGKHCTPECTCYGCHNNEESEALIAKAKQMIKQKNQLSSDNLKQFKGCNCKKSMCQKKYCECFNAGVPCGEMCKCEECANNDEPCSHKSIKVGNEQ